MANAGSLFSSGTTELRFVAGENLTIGDTVSLGTDGKAYKSIGLLNNSNISSPFAASVETVRYILDQTASKVIALGTSATTSTSDLRTCVGTIGANGSLSWGAVTSHTMAANIGTLSTGWAAVRQTTNQLMVAYFDVTNLRCRIVSYSGTTTTVGIEATTATTNVANSTLNFNMAADSSGRVLISWFRNNTTFTLWGARATVSGTTITLGTETQIVLTSIPSAATDQRIDMLYDSTQDRILMFVQHNNGGNRLALLLMDISTTVSRVQEVEPGSGVTVTGVATMLSRLSGTSSYLIRYVSGTTSTEVRVVTISTTAITLGTARTLTQNSNTIGDANWCEDTVNNKIIFGYGANGCEVFTRSGTSLTFESANTDIDFTTGGLNFFSPYVVGSFNSLQQIYSFATTTPRQVGTLSINTSGAPSQARTLTTTAGITYVTTREAANKAGSSLSRFVIAGKLTNECQLGISTQTVSSGATVKVALRDNKVSAGKIISGLSGLTPGVHYYADNGTAAVIGSTYLGFADSATELVLSRSAGAET